MGTSKQNDSIDDAAHLARLVALNHRLTSTSKIEQSHAYRELLEMANLGCSEAMHSVARCLAGGTGVEQDNDSSHFWLERSASAEPAPRIALFSLGMLHVHRDIRGSSISTGLYLLGLAASGGYNKALEALLTCCEVPVMALAARKATYRVLANAVVQNSSDPEACDALFAFTKAYDTYPLLDS